LAAGNAPRQDPAQTITQQTNSLLDKTVQRVYATVLFADIRDFTSFRRAADLSELIKELNECYAVMQQVINSYGGIFNKFGDDSLLALFGPSLSFTNHAHQAATAAIEIIDQLASLNRRRVARGSGPFRIGIGVNTGEVIVGHSGLAQGSSYTVLGESVHTAKRLSDLNKETPVYSVFVSDNTLDELPRQSDWQVENLGEVYVMGKEEAITVYALMHNEL
jgi:class 3 adenylate cyclase